MHHNRGLVPRQAHVSIPEGTCEEEFAREGFFGRASHLYRRESPVGWINIEGDCKPQCIETGRLPGLDHDDYLTGRVPFLTNADVTLGYARFSQPMAYHFRNADADEVLFVHRGNGRLETDFGPLQYEVGDYLVIPRGTVYRFVPAAATELMIIESVSEVTIPDRGIIGQHALFDPDVMNVPTPEEPANDDPTRTEWQLKIQRCGEITTVTYPYNPIQTVGWKGDLSVWQLNIRDIRPISSERYHLPPTAHCTFMCGPGAVICTFLPRPLETGDPEALRVPFFHANIDYDEVLFYHDGEFFSRKGIDAGMVTFHPQGIHHGPQPGAKESAETKTRTNEKAVMVDTRRPLQLTPQARKALNENYWKSWMQKPVTVS